ncbi:MAG: uncharacterized protein PWQ58_827 [Archaeoglobaceae archaeon]|nr:uncharacterized protein [Archaeoglobaceae archaeon]
MILPKTSLTKIERGKFSKILENLILSKFSGYIKVGFKKEELCSAEVLLENGEILAAEIVRVKSRTSIYGDDALSELANLENSVVEIYVLNTEQIKRAYELNKSAKVSEGSTMRLERNKIIEKYGIANPDEREIEQAITMAIGNSELAFELEREKIMNKYGIKKPSEEEIDYLISNALGEETEVSATAVDFEQLKKEILDLLYSKIGKPSRKTASIIESCGSYDELIRKGAEIEKSLKTLVMFVPREKIDEVISDIEQKIGKKLT